MTTASMPVRTGEFLLSESEGTQSRESVTLIAGAGALLAGAVIGRITKQQAAAPIPAIVGTGTGLMSALTFGPDVQVGAYVITLLATSGTAAFSVTVPDSTVLPNGTVGATYKSNHLSFLISNSGVMTSGDHYTVTVTAGGTPVVMGGTGTGTMSAISLGPQAQLGTYKVVLQTAVTNGGDFDVLAPDDTSIGRFIMGTTTGASAAFASDHVNFTLTDATDFIAGRLFNIIVCGYVSPQAKLWDPLATDGTQDAWGILYESRDATSSAQNAVAIVRSAEAISGLLLWKPTITAAQKTQAYRQFATAGLVVRS
jgi:hypothetical protein